MKRKKKEEKASGALCRPPSTTNRNGPADRFARANSIREGLGKREGKRKKGEKKKGGGGRGKKKRV